MSTVLIVLVAVLLLVALWAVITYNRLIGSRNMVDEGWSGIDVQLQRRHELIPNLVEAVKGYAAHERETLETVTDARADAVTASGPAASGVAEGVLGQALDRLFAVAEAYPELRAAENFQQLQAELVDTEDQIAAARRIYNGNVQIYNTRIQVFPNVLIARAGHFERRVFFEIAAAGEREPEQVDLAAPPR